jgi:protein-disulfide isomerase
MHKVMNILLLIILVGLISLFSYKTFFVSKEDSIVLTSISEVSPIEVAEKERIGEVVKEYLVKNPEAVVEAMEAVYKRKTQEVEELVTVYIKDHLTEIEDANSYPVVGNKDGDVTIVYFYDYNCSYCKTGYAALQELIGEDKKIKVILRPLPILGQSSNEAATYFLAAYKLNLGTFQSFHDGLLKMKNITPSGENTLLTNLKLDVNKVKELSNSQEVINLINQNFEIASSLKIRSVPTYVINGQLITRSMNLVQLQQVISKIRNM